MFSYRGLYGGEYCNMCNVDYDVYLVEKGIIAFMSACVYRGPPRGDFVLTSNIKQLLRNSVNWFRSLFANAGEKIH